jgi:hypothetical protein
MEKVQSSFESKTTALAELKKKYLDEKQLLEEQHRRSLSDIKEVPKLLFGLITYPLILLPIM